MNVIDLVKSFKIFEIGDFVVCDTAEINPVVLKSILLQCSPDFLTLHKY